MLSLASFRKEVYEEYQHILQFWEEKSVDNTHGGFIGALDGNNKQDHNAEKSTVLMSRILWTFSHAYLQFKSQKHLSLAKIAYDDIMTHFIDLEYGGAFWSNAPDQKIKQNYAQAFCIYGLSEYYLASKDIKALQVAKNIFTLIEKHSYDPIYGGYIEARGRQWEKINDYILCSGESEKSMNTHLHLLEAYSNLYKAWKNPLLKTQIKKLLQVFLTKIVPGNTMGLFFDKEWKPLSHEISYGHDIEASWLLYEAAESVANHTLLNSIKTKCLEMAKAACLGLNPDGSMSYEYNPITTQTLSKRDWWVQAEAMVGFYNAYQLSKKIHFLDKAIKTWEYVKTFQIDHKNGEWFGSLNDQNKPNNAVKINAWKCPYHNSRACIEMYRRLSL